MSRRLLLVSAALLSCALLAAQTPTPPPDPFQHPSLQSIVIDPGHGGDDAGVTMSDEVIEKQLTLDVARRIKSQVESRLGIRVVLTRDEDKTVGADQRTSVANNSKSDLFLSLHFNAGLAQSAGGAQVYYVALDRELQEALRASQADSVKLPTATGAMRSIDLIRWDMAQARHLQQSAALAGIVAEALRAQVPMASRPIQQAPMRALMGIDMPAVVVEMGYLTNPTQAKAAGSAEFQASIVQAVYDSLVRFRGAPEGAQ